MIKIFFYSTNFKILKLKFYFLIKFLNIFHIKYSYYFKNKINKIRVLKSPNIHKKAWRKYELNNLFSFIITFNEKKISFFILVKLHIILHKLSQKSLCKILYLKN